MSGEIEEIRYLIFDIESVADPNLVAQIRHPHEDIDPLEALERYRKELLEQRGSDFIPYTFQVPISVAVMKVNRDFTIDNLIVLRHEDGGPQKICENFWKGWSYYHQPTFVTFNGRGFDLPLMELMAFRYGVDISEWFKLGGKSYEQPRNRYNLDYHFDLNDVLTNFGATHFTGGLNIASKMIRKPGKIDTKGNMVQDMFLTQNLSEIHQYCRCDVLDTYCVFLRVMVVCGRITPSQELDLLEQMRHWLRRQAVSEPIYQTYLQAWDERQAPAPPFFFE